MHDGHIHAGFPHTNPQFIAREVQKLAEQKAAKTYGSASVRAADERALLMEEKKMELMNVELRMILNNFYRRKIAHEVKITALNQELRHHNYVKESMSKNKADGAFAIAEAKRKMEDAKEYVRMQNRQYRRNMSFIAALP